MWFLKLPAKVTAPNQQMLQSREAPTTFLKKAVQWEFCAAGSSLAVCGCWVTPAQRVAPEAHLRLGAFRRIYCGCVKAISGTHRPISHSQIYPPANLMWHQIPLLPHTAHPPPGPRSSDGTGQRRLSRTFQRLGHKNAHKDDDKLTLLYSIIT